MKDDDPDRAAREQPGVEKRLVIVAHGLGDQTPGETVRPLARALASASGRPRVPTEEVLWLTEGSGRQVEDFPCHVERLRDDGVETVLAEVRWSDLSRLGHGMLAIVLGILRLVFGVHHVIRHAADPARLRGSRREPAAAALQWLSQAAAYLLRGPAAAAMLVFVIGWVVSGVAREVAERSFGGPTVRWVLGVTVAVGLVELAIGIWGFRWQRGRAYGPLFLWLAVFASTTMAAWLMAAVYPPEALSGFGSQDAVFSQSTWVVAFVLVQIPQLVAFLLILLATVAWAAARLRAEPERRPGLDLAQALSFLALALWLVLTQLLMLVILGGRPEKTETFELLREWAATNASFSAIFVLLFLAVAGGTAVRLLRWTERSRAATYRPSRPAPRLVFGTGILASLILMPVVLLGVSLSPSGFRQELIEGLGPLSNFVALAVPFVVGVAGYFSAALHFIIDFLLDFVSHFERQSSEIDGRPAFVRRERIRQRFRVALKSLIRQERPDRLTVLAHSQGTVVAADALAEAGAGALLEPLARCDLVTMGSPLGHLYQRYFPNDYPPLDDERWEGLRRRVDRWINIFRIDDPLGIDIEPGGEWPENCPVDPGGHTGYWKDRQVLQILRDRHLV